MNELILDKWEEPYYIEKLDIYKGKGIIRFLCSIFFMFISPNVWLMQCGIFQRKVVKLLNTKTGKTRIIREEIKYS